MNEKAYEIAVDVADLAYPLEIERQIRLRSRLAMLSSKTDLRMTFIVEGRKNGKFGSACRMIDLPQGTLLPDGDPVFRSMLDAFCDLWWREREDKNTEFLSFRISLMDYDIVDQYKDVFTIKAKEV